MATYAIGDVQGCFDELQLLLDKVGPTSSDKLWFCGDLINRGPKSLETLEFVRSLGKQAITVLGNHDLHFVATYYLARKIKKNDTLAEVLAAKNCDELVDWLCHQKIMHHSKKRNTVMLHAGLPPQWDLSLALDCAAEVEDVLQDEEQRVEYMSHMYGDMPNKWRSQLSGWERVRFITNCFTRMRYCNKHGELDLVNKLDPGTQPSHLKPWFEWEHRKSKKFRVVFGHWSTLGLNVTPEIVSTDTGCLWGGKLTAVNIDTNEITQVNSIEHLTPAN